MEALLTYTDSDGLLRLHLLRGVELLPRPQGGRLALKERSPAEPTAEEGGRLALFEAWLAEEVAESVSPEGSAGAGRARATRGELIVELLADKVAKAGWQAASGGPGQQRAAVARRERFEARVTCARRRGERAARERAALVALERTCEDLHARSVQHWGELLRRRAASVASRAVYSAETFAGEQADLLRERGVFGPFWAPNTPRSFWAPPRPMPAAPESAMARLDPLDSWHPWFAGQNSGEPWNGWGLARPAAGGDKLWWRLDLTEGPQRLRRRLELDVQEMGHARYTRSSAGAGTSSGGGGWRPMRDRFLRAKVDGQGSWEVDEDMVEPAPMVAVLPGGKAEGARGGVSAQLANLASSQLAADDLWRFLSRREAGEGGEDKAPTSREIQLDKLQWALEQGDAALAAFNCARLESGTPVPGVLLVCARSLYLFEHCSIEASGDVVGQPALAPTRAAVGEGSSVRRWAHRSIRDIQRRRYLLRPVGLEIFSDGKDCLLILNKAERQAALDRIWGARSEALAKLARLGAAGGPERAHDPGTPEKRLGQAQAAALGESVAVDLTDPTQTSELAAGKWTGRASVKTLLKNLRRRWAAREISNLQYLMHLNTLAGRSYHDLTQYPVMPWVLADYSSASLDLSDPSVFRDLSKPMGAQCPARASQFRARFEEWVDPDPEHPTPRFHYATHYSSAAYVTFFLLRLEPFTSAHVQLQGGKFDHAERLFTSVAETWESASAGKGGGLSDVKELTPEFYFMPDFLRNVNRLDLGTARDGSPLGDVVLPPWANGSAEEFVRKMRQALESEHVSTRLHLWIDLVFGFRQRGPPAEEALNVFHHLTYEGAVDVDAVADPVERRSAVAQILNFGQTVCPPPPALAPAAPAPPSRPLRARPVARRVPGLKCSGGGVWSAAHAAL